MSYVLKKIKCNSKNFGSQRNLSDIKYLVIHYTANKTDTAVANGNYFRDNVVKASAHYFVDDTTVVQSVEDYVTAWAVGGKKYDDCNETGGGSYYAKCTNSNSISIEMCCTNYTFSEKTIENTIELAKNIVKKYNIDKNNIIRHFDVVGKICPKPFVDDFSRWNKFKNAIFSNDEVVATETKKKKIIYHIVEKNETLTKIAKKYNVTVKKIAKWNNIEDTNKIYVNQKLMIKVTEDE